MNRFSLWIERSRPYWKSATTLLVVMALAGIIYTLWPKPEKLTFSGIVQAQEIKNGSRFGGRVLEVRVEEGETVKKGDALVVFDNAELRTKLEEARALLTQAEAKEGLLVGGPDTAERRQAQANVRQAEQRLRILAQGGLPEEVSQSQARLKQAETTFNQAKLAYDNADLMLREGIISQQKHQATVDDYLAAQKAYEAAQGGLQRVRQGARREEMEIARSQLSAAKAQYEQMLRGAKPGEVSIASADIDKARSAVEALEAEMEEMTVKAPLDGVVTVVAVHPGELVNPGQPVVAVIDYTHLWADLFLPESALDFARLDAPVDIHAPVFKKAKFTGKVVFVNPKSEFMPSGSGGATSREESSFRVKVSISARDRTGQRQLLPGMKVDVTFTRAP